MLIDIASLDEETIAKIPNSILLNLKDNFIDTDLLPIETTYQLRNYKEIATTSIYIDPSVVDLNPNFNVYTDFLTITSKNNAILEYVKNYLQVDKGDYPFDPTFGTLIKEYLQKLDTPAVKISLKTELDDLTEALSISFNTPIKVIDTSLKLINGNVYSEYALQIVLKVEEEISNVTFTKSLEHYYLQ